MQNKLFIFIPKCKCLRCGNDDLNVVTTNERINLSFNKILKAYLQNDKSVFNKYRFLYLECPRCGAKYKIKWIGELPYIYSYFERNDK